MMISIYSSLLICTALHTPLGYARLKFLVLMILYMVQKHKNMRSIILFITVWKICGYLPLLLSKQGGFNNLMGTYAFVPDLGHFLAQDSYRSSMYT